MIQNKERELPHITDAGDSRSFYQISRKETIWQLSL